MAEIDDETELHELEHDQIYEDKLVSRFRWIVMFIIALFIISLAVVLSGCTPLPHIGCIKANTNEDCNTFG